MDNSEVLKAGPCADDVSLALNQKDYYFNSNSNLFLSVGGVPSTGW